MSRKILAQYHMPKTKIIYMKENEIVGCIIVPNHKEIVLDKDCDVQPLVQLKLIGDDFNGQFTNGHTMYGSKSTKNLKFNCHYQKENSMITVFTNDNNHTVTHYLVKKEEYDTVESYVVFENNSDSDTVIEMITSFSLSMLPPFDKGESTDTLVLHRLQSFWSGEGRLQSQPIEQLMLEPPWIKCAIRSERFGQIGSLPVRKYFPFMALQDMKNNVTWGVQLHIASSWQMEVLRYDNGLILTGGLADRDFGHFAKCVKPNEHFTTPKAAIAVSEGGIDEITNKLVNAQSETLKNVPRVENNLPIVFNEYCTTWGNPSFDNIKKIADTLKGKGLKYLVMDSGWYKDSEQGWYSTMGDWIYSKELFPNGLKQVADYIKECGMIPGLWFEFEVVGCCSKAYNFEEHLLKRDGVPITVGERRFWDMTDPWVIHYLSERVIKLLKECGFGYLKVDYNDSIGIGADGDDSFGEKLRKSIAGTQEFFKKIKNEIPDMVIENCSSGGHRLEPSMMNIVSQASFSDAHECQEIPIIAANLHRAIHPAQSQIWAVLRCNDTDERLYYSIINTFLGRMCLSGEIYDLSKNQWNIVEDGIEFYHEISHIIKNGKTNRYGNKINSYNSPNGHQAILRTYKSQALLVIHTFINEDEISIPLPQKYIIEKTYGSDIAHIQSNTLTVKKGLFKAKAFLLKKK